MFNGSGVYTLPGAALANGEIVSATENNQFRNDVAAALNVAWTRDGQAPATANIPMGSHKLTGLAAGTGVGDSVRFEQLPSATNKLDLTTSVTGALPVANGGSGAATLTGVLKGNGTSAFTAAVAGTDYLAPAAIGTTVQGYNAELQGATQGGINGMKNRIINGAMMNDQRNAGASVTPGVGNNYNLDRFVTVFSQASKLSFQQVADAPAGFKYSTKITVASQYAPISTDYFRYGQFIEGLNIIDLAFGTASASSITISLWVKGSVAGTYSISVRNLSQNRSYVGTISVTNSWAQQTVTLVGETTGTWSSDNTLGMQLYVDLGSGSDFNTTAGAWQTGNYTRTSGSVSFVNQTAGATLNITGVQLEKGSTATSFDYRPYGTELMLCYRYAQPIPAVGIGYAAATNLLYNGGYIALQPMRASPTLVIVPTYGVSGGSAGTVGLRYATPNGVSLYNSANNWSGNPDVNIATAGLVASEL